MEHFKNQKENNEPDFAESLTVVGCELLIQKYLADEENDGKFTPILQYKNSSSSLKQMQLPVHHANMTTCSKSKRPTFISGEGLPFHPILCPSMHQRSHDQVGSLSRGGSLSSRGLCPGDHCPEGVPVQRGLCPGGSLLCPGGSLSRGALSSRVSV